MVVGGVEVVVGVVGVGVVVVVVAAAAVVVVAAAVGESLIHTVSHRE